MSAASRELVIPVSPDTGKVSALLRRPRGARWLLVLAHGAGAGMRHPFLEAMAEGLAARHIATCRYQFPYMQRGRRGPDRPPVLTATVRAAVRAAAAAARGLPLLAGGKSLGGRMTSLAASQEPLEHVEGIVFLGFPLHAPGRSGSERAEHLSRVRVPMLFLQGTRDKLADLERMRAVCAALGRRATLHVVDGGDHSFHVPKRSGRSGAEALDEIADAVASWTGTLKR